MYKIRTKSMGTVGADTAQLFFSLVRCLILLGEVDPLVAAEISRCVFLDDTERLMVLTSIVVS